MEVTPVPAINVRIELEGVLKFEDGYFISTCPALDLSSQGETEEQAKVNLEDAIALFVESCMNRGSIFQVLQNAGFAPSLTAVPAGPSSSSNVFPMSVPIPLLKQFSDSRTHA